MKRKSPKKNKLAKSSPTSNIALLEQALGGDKELVLFFIAWLKYNRNAGKAYQYLHPELPEHSCRTLGSRMVAKVDIKIIMDSYGLGIDRYLKKLDSGLEASDSEEKIYTIGKGKKKKFITKTIIRPNHSVQKAYHDKLGEILKVEGSKDTTNVAVQVNNLISEKKNKYGI